MGIKFALIEFPCEAVWFWTFVWGVLFDYCSIFVLVIGLFKCSSFHDSALEDFMILRIYLFSVVQFVGIESFIIFSYNPYFLEKGRVF